MAKRISCNRNSHWTEGSGGCLQAVFQEKAGAAQIQEKGQGEKKFHRRCIRGEDVFKERVFSVKAGHVYEDATILSSEPLYKPGAQDGPHL